MSSLHFDQILLFDILKLIILLLILLVFLLQGKLFLVLFFEVVFGMSGNGRVDCSHDIKGILPILNHNVIGFESGQNCDESPLIKLSVHQLLVPKIHPQKLLKRHAVRSVNHPTDILDSDLLNLYLGNAQVLKLLEFV